MAYALPRDPDRYSGGGAGGKTYVFPENCLSSGGSCNYRSARKIGDWDISKWPEGFPEELKDVVLAETLF